MNSTPMILALCTLVMKRPHKYVQQLRDVVFIDTTSTFDSRTLPFFAINSDASRGSTVGYDSNF